jgi:hypothetical protein
MFRAVNPFACKEPIQNFRALRREDIFRHPFVFHPDLVLGFPKPFGGLAKNGQVHICKARRVSGQRRIVTLCWNELAKLTSASTITVKTSADSVPIAFLPEINYYDVLAEKLKWRGDGISKPRYGYA